MKCKLCGEESIDWTISPDIKGPICTQCWKDCDCTGLEKL